jgi:hypothetical protein
MSLFDLTDFFKLSSVLNYNLSATSLNRYNVLRYILRGENLDPDERKDQEKKAIVMEALGYLFNAYRQKRRRLGPMAVLHPLRATALLARSLDNPNLVILLSILFHDVLEDINPSGFNVQQWKEMEQQLYGLLDRLAPEDEAKLTSYLLSLTKRDGDTYYEYIGRLLESADGLPEIVQVKLADRLDNTLDLRIDLEDPMLGVDFFQNIFQLMFVNNYPGYRPKQDHSHPTVLNGARRLYQLFKNSVLLSMIRQNAPLDQNHSIKTLFDTVAEASLKEAQRTLIHLIGYHLKDLNQQRELVIDAMDYCFSGRSDLVTKPNGNRLLDGLFSTYFGQISKKTRQQKLDMLYQNKPLMIQASIAFVVIFLSFLNDSDYYIQGISSRGILPR